MGCILLITAVCSRRMCSSVNYVEIYVVSKRLLVYFVQIRLRFIVNVVMAAYVNGCIPSDNSQIIVFIFNSVALGKAASNSIARSAV